MGDIAAKWRVLSGEDNWKGLLDPLDLSLRPYLIHYGERVQAISNNYIEDEKSKNCGLPRNGKRHLFSKVGLENGNSFRYEVRKYFYATTDVSIPGDFIKRSLSPEASARASNWIGYVAVTTDEGKAVLGRRDILVCWRGTKGKIEECNDIKLLLVPACKILGVNHNPKVHHGWYSMYTSNHEGPQYNSISCEIR